MNIVCASRITQCDNPIFLSAAFKFCQQLTKPEENGFHWPKDLMMAGDLDEFCAHLRVLELQDTANPQTLGNGHVPQTLYWAFDADHDEVVGLAKLRHWLTPGLLRNGGHISIGIGTEHRGQGAGTEFLQGILQRCHFFHLHDILLTARHNNWPSRLMIEECGGQLWDIIDCRLDDNTEVPVYGKKARYWIHLN